MRIMPSRLHARVVGVGLAVAALLVVPAGAVEIERVVTPAGIEAWLVSDATVPIVSIGFAFRGGTAQDPGEFPGTATMVSGLLDEGAGDLDSDAFQARLADLAVEMSFTARRDAVHGEMRTLSENRDEAFGLLRLALSEPRFDAAAVERVRGQMQARLRRDLQDPQYIAARRWSQEVFGDHPYALPSGGTPDSIAAIAREDLADYHGRVFARDNLVISVVGDIDAAALAPLLDTAFAGLPDAARLAEVPDVAFPQGADIVEAVELDIPQTVIQLGREGLLRDDPDFMAAFVVNHILGGGSFTSRLFREVRDVRGLAYSVYTYLSTMDRGGLFMGGVATRADRAAESLELIRTEVERIARDGPTQEELEAAKRYLVGAYALRFDTSVSIARPLVGIQLEGLGIDYINIRNDLVEAVTMDDARRAARRLLGDGTLWVTLVGRGAAPAGR